MKLKITAKNIKLTEAIKDFAQSKVDKLDKFFDEGRAEVVLSVDRKINQRAEITIRAGKKKFTAKAIENDLYKSIDNAILKIEAQVRKSKGKYVDSKRIAKEELSSFYGAPVFTHENDVKFSVIKQVEVMPMNPEDAAYEMEKLGYTFWMFLDEESKQINLIFKRLDGTYGLIQPVKAK
ncbi:MAG: ribosome-associated translation inhibitor RaiA [Elusimicrobiota bacterium]|jgi:putative sigma-54 modulation protein|nr:ribosome-associated translation inhibitor RaiA [Elusimicrobiota bacterium]